ncbi:MAG: DUF4369 domain-containing protein [Prevotella sp.]
MKKILGYILLTLVVVSCGTESGHFRIKGRLRSFNQGEFYVYSPDGGLSGMDTIKVADGRFSYETTLGDKATFVIVFPNYSELPVFGKSGATAEISGDASHLKEVEIKGDKTNEDMTAFRLSAANMTPPQAKKAAEEYIDKHPNSLVSIYLIKKYLINTKEPDYAKAFSLAQAMVKADKDNASAAMLVRQLKDLQNVKKGGQLPTFSAVDIDGKAVSGAKLKGKLNVIISWAGWNYESVNIQRELRKQKKTFGDRLQVIGICLDADTVHCRRTIRIDSLQWQTICDQKLWDSPTLRQLAITTVPGNIVADSNGKIIATNLSKEKLKDMIEKRLK